MRGRGIGVLWWIWLLLLPCTLYSQSVHSLPQDSVAYHLRGDYYTIYRQDEQGTWRIAEVLGSKEYFRRRTAELHLSYYATKERLRFLPDIPPHRPQLKINLTGDGDFRIITEQVEDGLPTLLESQRHRRSSTIAHTNDLKLEAKYGERLALTLQYNSETALWEQRNRFLLNYRGECNDLIQDIEVGNVRFLSSNPLIHTGQELLGLRGRLKMGAFALQFIMSRQQSRERSILIQGGKRIQREELPALRYDAYQHFFLSEFFAAQYDEALRQVPLIQSQLYITDLEVWVTRDASYPPTSEEREVTAYYPSDTSPSHPPTSETLQSPPLLLHHAERLPPSAYTLHPTLGFISLQVPLMEGQLLAVSYRYTYQGKSYQVGDLYNGGEPYRVMLLADADHSPHSSLWPLMMKNGYSLGGGRATIVEGKTRVEMIFKDSREGQEKRIIDQGEMAGRSWLDLFRLDRTNSLGEADSPDGQLDFLEGVTIGNRGQTLFIPYRTPFVTVPEEANRGTKGIYPILTMLYQGTPTEASRQVGSYQYALRVEYQEVGQQTIPLHSYQLLPGSVMVRSLNNGGILSEGVDYRINYNEGTLTLLTEQTGTLEVVIQERQVGERQQKNILGAELTWQPLRGLTTSATFLRYLEEEGIQRPRIGQENLRNTMWGLHANYHYRNRRLPLWLNSITNWSLQEPLSIDLSLSYAALSSEYATQEGNNEIIIEDFEREGHFIDLTYPYQWQLGSLDHPSQRAQMAWFTVDPLLTANEHPLQPVHLQQDATQRQHPLVAPITYEAFFPQKTTSQLSTSHLPLLNLSFYPKERGPYNTDASLLGPDGAILRPQEMIGSMTTSLPIQNLQDGGFHYLEFWLLDPFSIGLESRGEIQIDLGKMKEEILPDGMLNFEGAGERVQGEWGMVAPRVPQSYSFDLQSGTSIEAQDTGLDGLTSREEAQHPKYARYLKELQAIAPPAAWLDQKIKSPYIDPAGDDYRFFLAPEWDHERASILQRYRYINGMEGNAQQHPQYGIHSPTQLLPDTEDLNRNMLQEKEETFLRYTLPITTQSLQMEQPHILSEKWVNGARWVKVRLSLQHPSEVVGTGASLQQVQSVRLQITHATEELHLRIAQMRLIAHQWQQYQGALDLQDQQGATLQLHTLSSAEDYYRKPLRYLPPPRVTERQNTYHLQDGREEEKALALTFDDLAPEQPIAIYQERALDLRHYQVLSLWSHLESHLPITSGELELFIRLGQDPTANYYEYRQPLYPTSLDISRELTDKALVPLLWQEQNRVELPLTRLPQLKEERYQQGRDLSHPFEKQLQTQKGITSTLLVKGNPTLAEVRFIIIGVRNKGSHTLAGEVWLNELALSGANSLGGAALQGRIRAELPDLFRMELLGSQQAASFASLTSDVRTLPLSAQKYWAFHSSLEAGKLLPTQWEMTIPITYHMTQETQTPLYDPYQKDLLYQESSQLAQRDSRQKGIMQSTRRQFSILQLTTRKQWDKAKPYHPNHFKMNYYFNEEERTTPALPFAHQRSSTTELFYNYRSSKRNALQASSRWLRTFNYQQFQAVPDDTQQPSTGLLQTLQNQWDWVRSLQLHQELLPGLQLTFNSQTIALIHEDLEDVPRELGSSPFRWISTESLQSIAELGKTRYYHGELNLIYQTPPFRTKLLKGLSIKGNWRSQYRWVRGLESNAHQPGHLLSNEGRGTLQLYYRFPTTFSKWKRPYLEQLTLRYEHLQSSSVPGWLPLAGKALGIHLSEEWNTPSFAYRLALSNPARQIEQAYKKHLISNDQGTLSPPSTYRRETFDATLQIQPLNGSTIALRWHLSTEQHQQWIDRTGTPRLSGSIRFNTIAKPTSWKQISNDQVLQSFLKQRTLLGGATDGLPNIVPMPSIYATQELRQLHPWLEQNLLSLKISTSYHALLETPNYQKLEPEQTEQKGSSGTSQHYPATFQIPSLVLQENLQPLIALELQTKFGLIWQERYAIRKREILMPANSRLTQQKEREWSHSLSYSYSFPPLFKSKHPIFRSQGQTITLQALYTHSHSDIEVFLISSGDSYHTKGLQERNINLTTDYQLSQAIRLRLFYQAFERKALVSNRYSYPFRRTNYGISLLLSIR